ncbi:hypothetical protein D3C87_898120 [compost metagenome]
MAKKVSAFPIKNRETGNPQANDVRIKPGRAHAVIGPTTRGSKPEISTGHPLPLTQLPFPTFKPSTPYRRVRTKRGVWLAVRTGPRAAAPYSIGTPMSKPNLPPLPTLAGDDAANYFCHVVSVEEAQAYATAYAEEAVRPYIEALERIAAEEFISLGEGNVDVRPALSERDACDLARATLLGIQDCGACNGTGWVPRDPDIGTDQECFVCDGSGTIKETRDG